MMKIHFVFDADYTLDADVELPGSGEAPVAFKRNASSPVTGLDGPLVLIKPSGCKPWMASFAGGYNSADARDGIFSTPSPGIICVVSKGAGYWVDVLSRHKLDVSCFPIRQIEIVKEPKLLVFVDHTKIAAYDENGPRWETGPLCSDKLCITSVRGAVLEYEGCDAATGRTIGGALHIYSGHL